MAFASILRKSAAPYAIRLARVQRNYHSCIATAFNHGFQSHSPAINCFSTASYFSKANAAESLL
ncbi:hypothetical protein CCACVL1_25073 [Corchorus capsularis]|uniref:Uncharacterized protein n=1 Tax=Corchorus capsularis TaxID=210143 RepID=A0A1R3GM03_COCAP|nr:hypothetical protein CCACVL1_25073 [Corchorus capsularis]